MIVAGSTAVCNSIGIFFRRSIPRFGSERKNIRKNIFQNILAIQKKLLSWCFCGKGLSSDIPFSFCVQRNSECGPSMEDPSKFHWNCKAPRRILRTSAPRYGKDFSNMVHLEGKLHNFIEIAKLRTRVHQMPKIFCKTFGQFKKCSYLCIVKQRETTNK